MFTLRPSIFLTIIKNIKLIGTNLYRYSRTSWFKSNSKKMVLVVQDLFFEKFENRERIILTGDSAGGFFTMTTWFRMKSYFKENGIKPALLSFIYPAFGYRFDSPRYSTNNLDSLTPLLCHQWSTPIIWSKIDVARLSSILSKTVLINYFQLP